MAGLRRPTRPACAHSGRFSLIIPRPLKWTTHLLLLHLFAFSFLNALHGCFCTSRLVLLHQSTGDAARMSTDMPVHSRACAPVRLAHREPVGKNSLDRLPGLLVQHSCVCTSKNVFIRFSGILLVHLHQWIGVNAPANNSICQVASNHSLGSNPCASSH